MCTVNLGKMNCFNIYLHIRAKQQSIFFLNLNARYNCELLTYSMQQQIHVPDARSALCYMGCYSTENPVQELAENARINVERIGESEMMR